MHIVAFRRAPFQPHPSESLIVRLVPSSDNGGRISCGAFHVNKMTLLAQNVAALAGGFQCSVREPVMNDSSQMGNS